MPRHCTPWLTWRQDCPGTRHSQPKRNLDRRQGTGDRTRERQDEAESEERTIQGMSRTRHDGGRTSDTTPITRDMVWGPTEASLHPSSIRSQHVAALDSTSCRPIPSFSIRNILPMSLKAIMGLFPFYRCSYCSNLTCVLRDLRGKMGGGERGEALACFFAQRANSTMLSSRP